MAKTAQDPAERVKEYGQGKSALSADERDALQSPPKSPNDKRNFERDYTPPTFSKVQRNLFFFFAHAAILGISGLAIYGLVRHNELSTRLATADRELRGYADQLNRKAPAGSSPLVIQKVSYTAGSEGIFTIVTQGDTSCRLPVKPPDEKHNLYWVDGIEKIDSTKLSTAEYFCVDSVAFAGIGSESTN